LSKQAKTENLTLDDYFNFDDKGWLIHAAGIQEKNSRETLKSPKTPKKSRSDYKPKYRSGAYAIILCLYDHYKEDDAALGLRKGDIIDRAQKNCDSSFSVASNSAKHYTAWAAMKTVVEKGLVEKCGTGKYFHRLTDAGINLAENLSENKTPEISVRKRILQPARDLCTPKKARTISHEVFLVIDKRETSGQKKSKEFQKKIESYAERHGLKYIEKQINVGDFAFMAVVDGKELLLETIVERKGANDLASTLVDGRCYEQKERLKSTGLLNVVYLVETGEIALGDQSIPKDTLRQQIANFQYIDDFTVQEYKEENEAIEYLFEMTKYYEYEILQNPDKVTALKPFHFLEQFTKSCLVSSPKDIYLKQLMAIHGISLEKAEAVAEKFPTLSSLLRGLKQNDAFEALKNVKFISSTANKPRSLGSACAEQIFWFYGS